MKDTTDWNDIGILPRSLGLTAASEDTRERRELLIMQAGARKVGIFADEAERVTENLRPTPLPHAPPAVLGVVSVRGRISTVINPVALLEAGDISHTSHRRAADATVAEPPDRPIVVPRYIVSLRGDEQLALAVERIERIIEILIESVQGLSHAAAFVRGVTQHDSATIIVLDPSRLFEAATQGTERRRKRGTLHDELPDTGW